MSVLSRTNCTGASCEAPRPVGTHDDERGAVGGARAGPEGPVLEAAPKGAAPGGIGGLELGQQVRAQPWRCRISGRRASSGLGDQRRPCRHTGCRGRSRACCGCRRRSALVVGTRLALARCPARRLGNLAALEHPLLDAVANDALAQPVVEDIGQVIPGELEDVAGILRRARFDMVSMRPVTNTGGVMPAATNAASTGAVRLAADGEEHHIGVLFLEIGDHSRRSRPDRACCSAGQPMVGNEAAPSPSFFRPSPRLELNNVILEADERRPLDVPSL